MQVRVGLKHTWSSQLSQSRQWAFLLLTRILEIVQHLPDTSQCGVEGRGTGNFSMKNSSGKQEKAKMAQIHGEATCVPSSTICSAYALHIFIRMPQAGGIGLSRAAGHLHCTCGAGTSQCGAGGTAADVSHHSSTGVTELWSLCKHTQQAQIFHPVPLPSTHFFQCFITTDGYHRNKCIFTSYS